METDQPEKPNPLYLDMLAEAVDSKLKIAARTWRNMEIEQYFQGAKYPSSKPFLVTAF